MTTAFQGDAFQANAFQIDASTVSGSFTADAVLRVPGSGSFTVDAVIVGTPTPTIGTTTVVILLGGVDVTSHVIFADAEFTQQANGQPGSARLRLRDLGHTLSPTAGQTLTVDVNGLRVWGGWALRVSPGYFFAVDDTSNPAQTERVWILEGVDYNILFSKRFLINRLNPTQMLPIYPKGTPDFQIVLDVVQRFLELNDDGISTSGVTHVGTPNLDGDFSAGNPGDSWGTSMNLIAGPTAAVFYIDPNKVLQFVDVETATAPFALSDHPDHTTSFGYRDMEITNDGTKLVNDMMVWGAGAHSTPDIRFVRVQDATSIATHGRWQQGEFTSALFTTSGVTQRAESFVYGTPQSKRGGKDDAIQISCVTYHPGLTAGQIINFSSTVFGYSDTLPIRRLGIRFPNLTSVEFRVFLSYDIDAPWSDYEFWFPRINFQPPTGGGIGGVVWPPVVLPPTTGCSDDVCGITDTFTRTIAETIHTGTSGVTVADIGSTDAGPHWGNPAGTLFGLGALLDNGNVGVSVNGSSLLVRAWATAIGVVPGQMSMVIPEVGSTSIVVDHTATKSVTFSMDSLPGHAGNNTIAYIYFNVGGGGVLNNDPFIWINALPTSYPIGTWNQSQLSFGPTSAPIAQTLIPNSWWQVGVTYTLTLIDNGTDTIATISDGTTTYSTTHSGFTSDVMYVAGMVMNYATGGGGVSAAEQVITTFDDFNVPEINRCSLNKFDTFLRFASGVWGTATSGAAWTTTTQTNANVDVYGVGLMDLNSSSGFAQAAMKATTGDGEWWRNPSYDMVAQFQCDNLSNVAILRFLFFEDTFTTYRGVDLRFADGSIDVLNAAGDQSVGYSGWANDLPMMLRFQVEAGVEIRARVWVASDPEPGTWNVVLADADATIVPNLRVEGDDNGLATDSVISVVSIDFDSAGKPCHAPACADFDDFSRTTPDMDWGSSTPTGFPWDIFLENIPGAGSAVDAYVDTNGNLAAFQGAYAGGPTAAIGVEVANVTDAPFNADAWTMIMDFNGLGYGNLNVVVRKHDGTASRFVDIRFDPTGTFPTGGQWAFGTSGVGNKVAISIPQGPYVYRLKWDYKNDAYDRFKVWLASDPEPVDWLIDSGPGFPGFELTGPLDFQLSVGNTGGGGANTNASAQFYSICYLDSAVLPVSGPAVGGVICQQFPGGVHQYTVSQAYTPGTTKVYVDGTFQGLNAEYSETDPTNGIIYFGVAPAPPATVTVCFTATVG